MQGNIYEFIHTLELGGWVERSDIEIVQIDFRTNTMEFTLTFYIVKSEWSIVYTWRSQVIISQSIFFISLKIALF